MAGISNLLECWVGSESTFCENAENPSANTVWDWRIPILDYSVTPNQERIRDGGLRSRMNEESLSHPGVRSATLELEAYLPGHLTTTAGALTPTWIQDLLADALGGGSTAMVGTTISSATTATSFTPTATTGWAVGMPFRVGVKGDGRCEGQAGVLATVGSPSTSLVALPSTPGNNDVVYAMQVVYHDESQAFTLGTKRFMVGYSSSPTAGEQYQLMGGQLSAVKFTFPIGDLPRVRLTYQCAYWQRNAETIPSTSLTLANHYCAPVAGGSFFINDVGTATRTTLTPSEIMFDVDLGLEPIVGTGGNGTYQHIVGWVRSKAQPRLTVKIPFTTAYETWWDTANQSLTAKHILFVTNGTDGRAVALYLANVIPIGQRPDFPTPSNNQTYVEVVFQGRDGTTITTELTRSAWRLAMG